MEEIKNTLEHWSSKKEDFNPKLVAREETGCCFSNPIPGEDTPAGGSMDGMSGGPCTE